jgi:hypothetical protein
LRCLQIATAKENTLALSTKHGITGIEYGGIIETPHYQQQRRKTERLKQQARKFDAALEAQRKEWIFVPPSAMVIHHHRNQLILCVPQTVGRTLLHRRECSIIERDYVAVDAVLEGEHEQVLDEFGIGRVAA